MFPSLNLNMSHSECSYLSPVLVARCMVATGPGGGQVRTGPTTCYPPVSVWAGLCGGYLRSIRQKYTILSWENVNLGKCFKQFFESDLN